MTIYSLPTGNHLEVRIQTVINRKESQANGLDIKHLVVVMFAEYEWIY